MHYNYNLDKNILKTLIQRNILPTDPNKKKLIIYYNKFNTSNSVINNNSFPSIGVMHKTYVIYQFKCPLGHCISKNNNIHVGFTSTTLSRRLTMHLFETTSIAQHLKTFLSNNWIWKILTDNTTIFEHQNSKKKKKIYKYSNLFILETNILNSIELILNPVQMNSYVFRCCCYL